MNKEILLVGGRISSNLDKFIKDYDLPLLNSITEHEYRFYSLCKYLNGFNLSIAVSKESNSAFSFIDAPIHTYRKKLWADDLEKIIEKYSLIIFSSEDFYGLPTILYSKKRLFVDLWNINIHTPKTKKKQFYNDFLIKPMIEEIKKRANGILYVADLQRMLFPDKNMFKVEFYPYIKEIEKNNKVLIIQDERDYLEKLTKKFPITTFLEPSKVAVSFNRNFLHFNWKQAMLVNYGIFILGDRRNITIKELKKTGLAYGFDSTNLEGVIKTISHTLTKKVKRKKYEIEAPKLVNFIKKVL